MTLEVTPLVSIPDSDLSLSFVRASGPGGQNVNKVSTAVQLRFDVANSTLPDEVRIRLRTLAGRRLSNDGVLVIVAATHRTQERNRADARERLADLIRRAAERPVPRRKTRPPKSSKRQRLDTKKHRSHVKNLRRVRSFD
jgi:ribosome-associated protein